jgi:hypothetical protein
MYWIQHTVMLILPFYLSLQGYPYTLEQFYQAILPSIQIMFKFFVPRDVGTYFQGCGSAFI